MFSEDTNECCSRMCFQLIKQKQLRKFWISMLLLPREHAQAFICGITAAVLLLNLRTRKNNPKTSRNKYTLFGKPVCREMMCTALGVSRFELQRILNLSATMCTENEVSFNETRGRFHGKRKSHESSRQVTSLIDIWRELMGYRIPVTKKDRNYGRLIQLPHRISNDTIYKYHMKRIGSEENMNVSYSSIFKIWKDWRPYVRRLSIISEICTLCLRFRNLISAQLISSTVNAQNTEDAEMQIFQQHRESANASRIFYKELQETSCESYEDLEVTGTQYVLDVLKLGMDFAESEQVLFHTNQEGEMYFLSPLKVALFRVTDEGTKERMTFLLPENITIRKKASALRSMLLTFLKKRNDTFMKLQIFTDNSCGENKTFVSLHYLHYFW